MIVTGKTQLHNRWGFLMLPHDLGRMYRHLFLMTFGTKLQRPSNSEHITIISPWDETKITGLPNREMTVKIIPKLWCNHNAFWLDAESEDIDKFRAELGLGQPGIALHFCIGYRYQYQDGKTSN